MWFIVDYFNDYYVITNRRIVRHDAVFLIYENQLEAPLERIQDITTRGSIFAKIFNYAYLDIRTAGVGSIPFDMIPDPEEVLAKIRELQGQMKAGSKAEQIENLRNQVIKALKMRLTPSIPSRVLPVTHGGYAAADARSADCQDDYRALPPCVALVEIGTRKDRNGSTAFAPQALARTGA